jgi:hypothetical protein
MFTPVALTLGFAAWGGWISGVNSTLAGTNVMASTEAGFTSAGSTGWIRLLGGMRLRRLGNYWIKEVDPSASWFWRWWARGALDAQARALVRLGDMAPSFLYQNGRLIIRHAGAYTPGRFWSTWFRGSWRMRTPFNDIVPRNIGANGLIFDPALHPLQQLLYAGGTAAALAGGGYLLYESWPLIWGGD